jgi:RNA-directed DNA polymerase
VHGSKVRLTKEYRDRLQDHVRGIEKFGLGHHAAHRHFASIWGMVRHIQGLLSYAIAVEGPMALSATQKQLAAVLVDGI